MENLVPGLAVRILADDLTGALDAAGPIAARCGPMTVYWDAARAAADAGERVALDTATREVDRGTADARTRAAVHALWAGRRGLAFQKIDSVWRGNPAAEIAAASVEGGFERIVVAPAFPQQGRVTRNGAQWVAEGGHWRCVAPDIVAQLRGAGLDAATEADASPSTRAIVCDAASAAGLDAIVARHWSSGAGPLWCGTSGLALALATRMAGEAGSDSRGTPVAAGTMRGPVLFVVGTNHPVSRAQAQELASQPRVICRDVDVIARRTIVSDPDGPRSAAVLVRFDMAPGTTPERARELIAQSLRDEVDALDPPGLVVATGGETLRALCDALGATRLDVVAEREPGIPISIWTDGRWAGTPILSKSGGFGAVDLFARVVAEAASHPIPMRTFP